MNELNEKNLKYSSKKFRVNEISKFLGITPRILKHYEETEVIKPDRSKPNDYREYTAEDVIKLQTAERLKHVFFTQREIASYFDGSLDIDKKRAELLVLREVIDNLIDQFSLELNYENPRYYISEPKSLLCYTKTFEAKNDALSIYFDSRETYIAAIESGAVCDSTNAFFVIRHNVFPLTNSELDENLEKDFFPQSFIDRGSNLVTVCVPILSAPKATLESQNVAKVNIGKSLSLKYIGELPPGGKLYSMFQKAANKLGITTLDTAYVISETGPNKKTNRQTYTFVISAEIGEERELR